MNLWVLIKALVTSAPRVSASEIAPRVRSGEAILVDVREPREWASGVAQHAVLLPLTDLTGKRLQWSQFLSDHRDQQLLFYCAQGGRSAIAARILAAEGFRTANAGHLSEWAAAGWPVVKLPPLR
jgi:rhodanese-related sulfurtransferase